MNEHWQQVVTILTAEIWTRLARAVIAAVLGWALAHLASRAVQRFVAQRVDRHHSQIAGKVTSSVLLGLTLAVVLHQLGIDLSLFLGAAGLLTVAIGFASQTAASNLISGLFLVGERPFVIGNTIRVGSTTGEVVSIDLLSVKLRTADNLLVRISNETLLKSEIINLSAFPIRRLDIPIGVDYGEDVNRVRALLMQVADRNPQCLDEPGPGFQFTGFGDSALTMLFSVWVASDSYLEVRTQVLQEIKEHFDAAGISMPFPQHTVHLAEVGKLLKSEPGAPAQTAPPPPPSSR